MSNVLTRTKGGAGKDSASMSFTKSDRDDSPRSSPLALATRQLPFASGCVSIGNWCGCLDFTCRDSIPSVTRTPSAKHTAQSFLFSRAAKDKSAIEQRQKQNAIGSAQEDEMTPLFVMRMGFKGRPHLRRVFSARSSPSIEPSRLRACTNAYHIGQALGLLLLSFFSRQGL